MKRRLAYEDSEQTHRDHDASFAKEVGATGWLGPTWPKKFEVLNAAHTRCWPIWKK